MLSETEQQQLLRAARQMAAAARKTERLRQIKALRAVKHSPDYLQAEAKFIDLLKEVG